ncbi:phage tail tape measure protein [Vreelandella alkaliphila]|uniref:phage tail tape measure protein n=1 Tax=Vreelandella alkaliphila TaxID=272774 RepID=UPI00197AA153|nr:phage tail tape measure protein [Halomonas alkaliphila]
MATNSIVSSPTLFNMGLMGEADPEAIVPLSRGDGGRLGIDASGLMRIPDGPLELPMPDIAAFPLLNRNDQQDVVRDMQRQIDQQNKEIIRLLKAMEQHTGASVDVQAEGAKRQITELQKSNAALDEMATAARLGGAR